MSILVETSINESHHDSDELTKNNHLVVKESPPSYLEVLDALPILFPRKSKILDHENWTKTIHHHSSTVQHNHTAKLLSLLRVLSNGNATYASSLLLNVTNCLKSQAHIIDAEKIQSIR